MTRETRTIQTWPSGIGYEYHGRPEDGPTNHRSLRVCNRNGGKPNRWRKGTADEWRRIVISQRAERYSAVEIYSCDSMLVGDLLKAAAHGMEARALGDLAEGFSYDEIRNLYPDPQNWSIDECETWLTDQGHVRPDRDDPEDEEAWHDTLRDAICDHAEPAEVYEWWRVSEWLCAQLHGIGEVTIDNDYGHWWGRTCTGQGYLMDGTLQRVAAKFD